uniref:SHSP domain-containing protein n=2 Tax=Caenorhabditis japonica TaxID=281687 RepID=A0A8R1EPT1_CAEJA
MMNVPVMADQGIKWIGHCIKEMESLIIFLSHVFQVLDDDTHFEVGLETHHFLPKEIEVKNIGELLEIHMEHTVKTDQLGDVSRSVTRCYRLPNNVDMKSIKSNLDSNGILHIRGNKMH